MSGRQTTFDAIRLRQIRNAPEWSWRTTGDPGMLELWHNGTCVGVLSLLPGHVEHRAVLMDTIVDHLNLTPR